MKLEDVIVAGFIAVGKTAETAAPRATALAFAAGLVDVTDSETMTGGGAMVVNLHE
jgi:predicted secreted protein